MSAGSRGRKRDLKIDDVIKEAERAYAAALKDIGKFNLAIFGKTGVGKSTLINAIFQGHVAETGTGRPVTLKTEYYEHPSGIFGVYDSEGIEIGQEGDVILERFRALIRDRRHGPIEDQVHVVWYCVRAADLRFEDGQAEFIRRLSDEGIPILFVLTQVQTKAGEVHPETVKFVESIIERKLPIRPTNLVFLTMAEEDSFGGFPAHGLAELLDATFRVAPDAVEDALIASQKLDMSRKIKVAQSYIAAAATSAAAIGAAPIPFADAVLLVPVQVGLMAKIAVIFGLPVTTGTFASLAGAALTAGGVTQAGKYIVTSLLKFVPGAGSIAGGTIRAGVASSLTVSVGEAWIAVCGQLAKLPPDSVLAMDSDQIKGLFIEELKRRSKRGRRS